MDLNSIDLDMNKIGKLRCGKAKKKFELEFNRLNNIGKSRCEEGNVVLRDQRSGPLLLVLYTVLKI